MKLLKRIKTFFQDEDTSYESYKKDIMDSLSGPIRAKQQEKIRKWVQVHEGEYSFAHKFESFEALCDQAKKEAFDESITDFISNNTVNERFLEEFACYIDWTTVCEKKRLSESFIETFEMFVDWDVIFLHQNLSKEFIAKHIDKTTFKRREEREDLFPQQEGFGGYIDLGGQITDNTITWVYDPNNQPITFGYNGVEGNNLLIGGNANTADYQVSKNLVAGVDPAGDISDASGITLYGNATVTAGEGLIVTDGGGLTPTIDYVANNGTTYLTDIVSDKLDEIQKRLGDIDTKLGGD